MATKCSEILLEDLVRDLSSRELQNKFQLTAKKKLNEIEKMVIFTLLRSLLY